MAPDPAHIETDIERRRNVEADPVDEHDRCGGGPEHFEYWTHFFPGHKRPTRRLARRLGDDDGARQHHDERKPKWEETAVGTVAAPTDAEAQGVGQYQAAEENENRSGNDVGR